MCMSGVTDRSQEKVGWLATYPLLCEAVPVDMAYRSNVRCNIALFMGATIYVICLYPELW